MTPEQCRQARELLGWSRPRLASFAGCAPETVVAFELGRCIPRASTLAAIQAPFEAAGIEFGPDDVNRRLGAASKGPSVTPEQCVQARKLLGWTRHDLALRARCASQTVKNVEEGRSRGSVATLRSLISALETAGVVFGEENEAGPSVRLRKSLP